MKWFKFYGQDFLTDPKMRVLTIEEKMCWIVLMCLANAEDKEGSISFLNEEEVMHQVGVDNGSPMWEETKGFLERFQDMGMIKIDEMTTVAPRNERSTASNVLRYNVTLTNFSARQERDLTPAERQKNYRERLKTKGLPRNERYNPDVTFVTLDKTRVDKNKAIEKSIASSKETIRATTDDDKAIKIERDPRAWRLRQKLYLVLEENTGVDPTPSIADYKQVQLALKTLNEDEIEDLFEEALQSQQIRTVRQALTARAIDIYRQDHV